MNSGEILSMHGVAPATVSHHLKILSEAGLIVCRREGQFVHSEAVCETIAAYTRSARKQDAAADSRNSFGGTSWKYQMICLL